MECVHSSARRGHLLLAVPLRTLSSQSGGGGGGKDTTTGDKDGNKKSAKNGSSGKGSGDKGGDKKGGEWLCPKCHDPCTNVDTSSCKFTENISVCFSIV